MYCGCWRLYPNFFCFPTNDGYPRRARFFERDYRRYCLLIFSSTLITFALFNSSDQTAMAEFVVPRSIPTATSVFGLKLLNMRYNVLPDSVRLQICWGHDPFQDLDDQVSSYLVVYRHIIISSSFFSHLSSSTHNNNFNNNNIGKLIV